MTAPIGYVSRETLETLKSDGGQNWSGIWAPGNPPSRATVPVYGPDLAAECDRLRAQLVALNAKAAALLASSEALERAHVQLLEMFPPPPRPRRGLWAWLTRS